MKSIISLSIDMGRSQERVLKPIAYSDGFLYAETLGRVLEDFELYLGIAYMGNVANARIVLDSKHGVEIHKRIGTIIDVHFRGTGKDKYLVCVIDIDDKFRDLFQKAV